LLIEYFEHLSHELHLHDVVDNQPIVKIHQKLILLGRYSLAVCIDEGELVRLEGVVLFHEFVCFVWLLGEHDRQVRAVQHRHHNASTVFLLLELGLRQLENHSNNLVENFIRFEDELLERGGV
jgi:hypothetical protein